MTTPDWQKRLICGVQSKCAGHSDMQAALDRIAELESQLKAAREDAARYHHLVETCNIDHAPEEPWQLVIWEPDTGEDWKAKLDQAIDTSIAHHAAMAVALQGGNE